MINTPKPINVKKFEINTSDGVDLLELTESNTLVFRYLLDLRAASYEFKCELTKRYYDIFEKQVIIIEAEKVN